MKFFVFAASLPFLAMDGAHLIGFLLLLASIVTAYIEPYCYALVSILAKALWIDP